MYAMYLETQMRLSYTSDVVIRPNFRTLLRVYRGTQWIYADVENHITLMKYGYRKKDTKVDNFDYRERRINWAYLPLYPTLAKILNIVIKSPFWSLCLLIQTVLLSIFVGFYYWSKANMTGPGRMLSAWLILLFFIIPPLGYLANFVMLPGFLIGIVFFALRTWLRSPNKHRTAFWVLIISSFLLGFTRFQGLLVNASLLFLILIIILWHKKSIEKAKVVIFFLANILPFIIIMCIFKYYANDPFAWAKVHAAWEASLTWPWTSIIKYWKSGFVFNLLGDELFFTSFRLAIFFIFACLAAKIVIFNKNVINNFILRRYRDSLINLYFLVISFGFLILPFLYGNLRSSHRHMTLAFLIILIWLEQSRRKIGLSVILFLLFVRAVEFTFFFKGIWAFIW